METFEASETDGTTESGAGVCSVIDGGAGSGVASVVGGGDGRTTGDVDGTCDTSGSAILDGRIKDMEWNGKV